MFDAIPIEAFAERVGLSTIEAVRDWKMAMHVVSLRQLVSIEALEPMRRDYLQQLVHSVRLQGSPGVSVYAASTVETARIACFLRVR